MENNYFPFLSPRTLRGYLFIMIVVLIVVPLIWRSQNQLSERVEACQTQQKVLEEKVKQLEEQIQLDKNMRAEFLTP